MEWLSLTGKIIGRGRRGDYKIWRCSVTKALCYTFPLDEKARHAQDVREAQKTCEEYDE